MTDVERSPSPKGRFSTTRWSVVLRTKDASADDAQEALTELMRSYWYPLFAFARRKGNNEHDAMDLTQGFFAHLLNGKALDSVSPEKGRFRSFLLASFKNFMANQRRAAETLRRGGAVRTVSLVPDDFSRRYSCEPTHDETPEICFQRNWAESLLRNVRTRLASEYRQAGKANLFELLEPHLTPQSDGVSRADIAQRLKLSTAAIAMSIHRMRRRYGEILREEVAATVDDAADVDDELRTLMSVVGR